METHSTPKTSEDSHRDPGMHVLTCSTQITGPGQKQFSDACSLKTPKRVSQPWTAGGRWKRHSIWTSSEASPSSGQTSLFQFVRATQASRNSPESTKCPVSEAVSSSQGSDCGRVVILDSASVPELQQQQQIMTGSVSKCGGSISSPVTSIPACSSTEGTLKRRTSAEGKKKKRQCPFYKRVPGKAHCIYP